MWRSYSKLERALPYGYHPYYHITIKKIPVNTLVDRWGLAPQLYG
jgi:hypothetical protein